MIVASSQAHNRVLTAVSVNVCQPFRVSTLQLSWKGLHCSPVLLADEGSRRCGSRVQLTPNHRFLLLGLLALRLNPLLVAPPKGEAPAPNGVAAGKGEPNAGAACWPGAAGVGCAPPNIPPADDTDRNSECTSEVHSAISGSGSLRHLCLRQ